MRELERLGEWRSARSVHAVGMHAYIFTLYTFCQSRIERQRLISHELLTQLLTKLKQLLTHTAGSHSCQHSANEMLFLGSSVLVSKQLLPHLTARRPSCIHSGKTCALGYIETLHPKP